MPASIVANRTQAIEFAATLLVAAQNAMAAGPASFDQKVALAGAYTRIAETWAAIAQLLPAL